MPIAIDHDLVTAVLADHGLGGPATRFPDGSLPVYATGDMVIKFYPADDADEADIEAGVLTAVAGRLPVPTPGVHAVGDRTDHTGGDWRYLLMDRLRGESLATVWPGMVAADRENVTAQVGRSLAALHAIDAPPGTPRPDWPAFVAAQRAGCADRQRRLGLDDHWLAQIPAFLGSIELPVDHTVLLHTEIMREHLLVERAADGWRLSGLIDFEPSMAGAPGYEFASVGPFLTSGDAPALRALLRAYGDVGPGFARRSLAYLLLHEYSNLRAYLERGVRSSTLDDLAEEWYGS